MSGIEVRPAENGFVRAYRGDKVVAVAILNEGKQSEFEPGYEVRFSLATKANVETFMRDTLAQIAGVL